MPEPTWDFSDLRALFINCTLKRSPELSHTEGLGTRSIEIMRANGVEVDVIRAIDHEIATGVYPDMTEHGWALDEWPAIHEQGHGRRHPRAAVADLAGREVLGVHQGDRAALREQPHPQLRRPVRLLRPGRRRHHHRQRGRGQALLHEHPLLAAAPRLHDPAAGRLRLARRGRPRPQLPGRGLGRAGQRLHESQHDVPHLEPLHMARMLKNAGGIPAHGNQRSPNGTQAAASTTSIPEYR